VEAVRQYEIWWADLPGPAGRRPVLLLTRDDAYEFLNKVVAAEITTTIRHIPIEVPLGLAEGLPKKCVVNCDNLRTIPKLNLVKRISRLRPPRIPEVKRAVGYALGWEELIEARG
jgi:mRNA interferase MazF